MSLIRCPECGTRVSELAASCPKCNAPAAALQAAAKNKGSGGFGKVIVLGLLAIGVAVVVLTNTSKTNTTQSSGVVASATTASQSPGVGQTISKGGWQVALEDYGVYSKFATLPSGTVPQGKLMVAQFLAKNLMDKTSNFTSNDLEVQIGDGRKFAPSSVSIDKGFFISQTVQPGLTSHSRAVFDIDPVAKNLHLNVLGLQFKLPD